MGEIMLLAHPDYSLREKTFYEKYDLVKVTGLGDQAYAKRSLKPRSERLCLFCGKRSPETKFSNLSHLLPQLMGNSNMYSKFECDNCNKKFSLYENDLANYLGVSRSLTGLFATGAPSSFTSGKLRTKSRSYIDENILIIDPRDLTSEGHRQTFRYTKNPYVPSRVYKALLKSALSLLKTDEIQGHYPAALNYLADRFEFTSGAVMSGYKLSFTTNLPLTIFHFKKRNPEEKIYTDVIIFNFQNHIIAFPIPLHRSDIEMMNADFSAINPPPYFLFPGQMPNVPPLSFRSDFSSTAVVSDDEEKIVLAVDPEELKKAVMLDSKTNKITGKDSDGAVFKRFIITRGNFKITDPAEFSKFINEQISKLNE